MDSSDGLNVGDVTGPRWAGGTRNPDGAEKAWNSYSDGLGERLARIREVHQAAKPESEAEVLREQLAAAEARADRAELEWAEADARTVLAVAAKADAWDEGARYVTHDSTYTEMFDIPKNPYRRTGDTNA